MANKRKKKSGKPTGSAQEQQTIEAQNEVFETSVTSNMAAEQMQINVPSELAAQKPKKKKKKKTTTSSSAAAVVPTTTPTTRLSPFRVLLLGATLLLCATTGFYFIPGMISESATGNKLVNAFYCAAVTLTTVGFGDVCPGDVGLEGQIFLMCIAFGALGLFAGPFAELAAFWKSRIPGGFLPVAAVTIGLGTTIFTLLEGFSQVDAVYASVITGVTIGYGDATPKTDIGKMAVACYAILVVNVVAGLLEPGRRYLEQFCQVAVKEKRD